MIGWVKAIIRDKVGNKVLGGSTNTLIEEN